MVINPFIFAKNSKIIFGAGKINLLPDIIENYDGDVLIITGQSSFTSKPEWIKLSQRLSDAEITQYEYTVKSEPSPSIVDEAVSSYHEKNIAVVVSIGGGSVIDAGKAISAMLPKNEPVQDYLEGVGRGIAHDGEKVPFIAIPTTSGTGSEATKNAVISKVGEQGFKKSLRHDNFFPDVALIDPNLMISCPVELTASCGLDTFSQLLESYVSTKASAMTDALALSGLEAFSENFLPACTDCAEDVDTRAGMAYASLISGITLANAGLGTVHGIAGPIGGFFNIPHGIACGSLLAGCMEKTIEKLQAKGDEAKPYLNKFAKVGSILSKKFVPSETDKCITALIEILYSWADNLGIHLLSKYGVSENDIDKIIKASSNKNNPIKLSEEDMQFILSDRI